MPVSTAVPSSLITSSPEAVRTASLFAVAVLASAAGAQSRGGVHGAAADPCPGARTQLALDECAARAATRADSAVGRAYRAVLARVDSTRRPALAEAQVAWERYRTAYCRYAASAYEGGSMQPMQYSFCMAGEAGLRARQLRRDAREEEGRWHVPANGRLKPSGMPGGSSPAFHFRRTTTTPPRCERPQLTSALGDTKHGGVPWQCRGGPT